MIVLIYNIQCSQNNIITVCDARFGLLLYYNLQFCFDFTYLRATYLLDEFAFLTFVSFLEFFKKN